MDQRSKQGLIAKVLVLVFIIPILTACLPSGNENTLIGKYKGTDGVFDNTEITFNEDGTCRWVMGSDYYDGTFEYDKSEGRWNVYVKGHGISFMGYDQVFFAKEEGGSLVIGGGRANMSDSTFIKE